MKTRKYIRLEVEFDTPVLDFILDLQDLAEKYPDLKVWLNLEHRGMKRRRIAMTKTLTEQWRDGTLPAGCYYVLSTEDDTPVACDIDIVFDFMIRDVVAPVPSYDEYRRLVSKADESVTKCNQLEKQLEIATKALKEIAFEIGDLESDYGYHYKIAKKALKEMEGVK